MRTPKLGEEWVWLPCEKHRFKQLRDLVWIGRSHEDQPEFVQEMELEHIRCGCRFPADDPAAALADLRRDEERHKAEMLSKLAAIQYREPRLLSFDVPWLLLAILGTMAALMYFGVFRG
jgi:hypothetical protein